MKVEGKKGMKVERLRAFKFCSSIRWQCKQDLEHPKDVSFTISAYKNIPKIFQWNNSAPIVQKEKIQEALGKRI